MMAFIGLEDVLRLLGGCGAHQLEQAVDFPELCHAHVHVVVQNGLEALLSQAVFAHVGQDGRHLHDRCHLIWSHVSAGLPPMESIVEHAQVVGHQTSTTDPHVHSTWVSGDDFLDRRERLSRLGHRRWGWSRGKARFDVDRPSFKVFGVERCCLFRFGLGTVSVAFIEGFERIEVMRFSAHGFTSVQSSFRSKERGALKSRGGRLWAWPERLPLALRKFPSEGSRR